MRRRKGGIVLMIFGLLVAALVGGAVYVLAQGAPTTAAEETSMALKVVSMVPQRTLIPVTALQVVEVPASLKPPAALSTVEEANNKMALSDLYPGDWVLRNRIADTKGLNGQSFTLKPGTVMVTFPGSDIIGTGAVLPGDSVDILVTIDTWKEEEGATTAPGAAGSAGHPGGDTQITIQNLKVLNIGAVPATVAEESAETSGSQQPKNVDKLITFQVSRDDALVLKQIKDYPNARMELVLRAAGDEQIFTVEAVNMKRLIERFNIKAGQ